MFLMLMLCSLCSGIVLVVGYMQIDNQLPLTPMPVILAPECKEKEESVLEIVLQMKSDSSEVKEVYPCIGLKVRKSHLYCLQNSIKDGGGHQS